MMSAQIVKKCQSPRTWTGFKNVSDSRSVRKVMLRAAGVKPDEPPLELQDILRPNLRKKCVTLRPRLRIEE